MLVLLVRNIYHQLYRIFQRFLISVHAQVLVIPIDNGAVENKPVVTWNNYPLLLDFYLTINT